MKKLDWYILRQLFTAFITCMLIFTVIAVAVDSSEKTDDFVKSGLTGRQIIRQYYIGFVPYIWGMLFPLFVFIAVVYSTSRMAMRTEIIAILATGTTYNRWLRTYLVGGIVFAVVLWFASAYSIPRPMICAAASRPATSTGPPPMMRESLTPGTCAPIPIRTSASSISIRAPRWATRFFSTASGAASSSITSAPT